MPKTSVPRKRNLSKDRKLIAAKQPFEVNHVRRQFTKMSGQNILHPKASEVAALIKNCNNSRVKVYSILESMGYEHASKVK